MKRHEGRGRRAELSHAHRPDHFKSACYGPTWVVVSLSTSLVVTSFDSRNILNKHFLLSYFFCLHIANTLYLYRLGLGLSLRVDNISHKWACYYEVAIFYFYCDHNNYTLYCTLMLLQVQTWRHLHRVTARIILSHGVELPPSLSDVNYSRSEELLSRISTRLRWSSHEQWKYSMQRHWSGTMWIQSETILHGSRVLLSPHAKTTPSFLVAIVVQQVIVMISLHSTLQTCHSDDCLALGRTHECCVLRGVDLSH